jgi:hypothetical protein
VSQFVKGLDNFLLIEVIPVLFRSLQGGEDVKLGKTGRSNSTVRRI